MATAPCVSNYNQCVYVDSQLGLNGKLYLDGKFDLDVVVVVVEVVIVVVIVEFY